MKDLYLTQDLFHLLLCHIQLTLLSKKTNQKMKTSKWLLISLIQITTTDLCQKLHNMDLMKVPQFLLLYLPHFIVVLKSVDKNIV